MDGNGLFIGHRFSSFFLTSINDTITIHVNLTHHLGERDLHGGSCVE
jgi:hypothetical protein